jgi:hypothetical protein
VPRSVAPGFGLAGGALELSIAPRWDHELFPAASRLPISIGKFPLIRVQRKMIGARSARSHLKPDGGGSDGEQCCHRFPPTRQTANAFEAEDQHCQYAGSGIDVGPGRVSCQRASGRLHLCY